MFGIASPICNQSLFNINRLIIGTCTCTQGGCPSCALHRLGRVWCQLALCRRPDAFPRDPLKRATLPAASPQALRATHTTRAPPCPACRLSLTQLLTNKTARTKREVPSAFCHLRQSRASWQRRLASGSVGVGRRGDDDWVVTRPCGLPKAGFEPGSPAAVA